MRLFQNSGLSPSYLRRLNRLAINEPTFAGRLRTFLGDRFGASHLLKPEMTGKAKIYCGDRSIFDLITRRLARTVRVEFWSWW